MNNYKFSLKPILAVASIFCLIVFCYLSVLGENDKAKGVTKSFMNNIKNHNYSILNKSYSKAAEERFGSLKESMKFHFILELALLQHFGLTNESDYSIDITRENLWFPILNNTDLKLSVRLSPNNSETFLPNFNKANPLQNLFTATREDGHWKIQAVNVKESILNNTFNETQSKIQVDKYVEISANGFVLKQTEIDLDKIDALEKKVIIHNLRTAIETLEYN